MKFVILDIGGNLLGPALGLRQLGHEVRYWTNAQLDCISDAARLAGIYEPEPVLDAEVVIYSASFSDEQWACELGIQQEAELRPDEPLFDTIHPGQAEYRNRRIESLVSPTQKLVLVDMGDLASTSSPFFLDTKAIKLKRELLPWVSGQGIEPFPYLYQPHMLHAELVGLVDKLLEEASLFSAQERSEHAFFGGTLDHWRYMGRRASLIEQYKMSHPDQLIRVQQGELTLIETWRAMQRCQFALSLPGLGELCFRHHETAALAIPTLSLEDFRIQVPTAWHTAFPTSADEMLDSASMRSFYEDHYHPICAAQQLVEVISPAVTQMRLG